MALYNIAGPPLDTYLLTAPPSQLWLLAFALLALVMPSPAVKALLGTVHDYTETDIQKLKEFGQEKCRFMVIGYETCPSTGRPHLHTVMQLKAQTRVSTLQAIVNPRVMNCQFPLHSTDPFSPKFVVDYCKKGECSKEDWDKHGNKAEYFGLNAEFWEVGKFVPPGTRTDLLKLVDAINEAPTFRSVLRNEAVAETLSRHLNFAKQVYDAKIPKPMEDFTPRPWQQKLLDELVQPPDARTIYWVCDPSGGSGKTTFATYLVRNHNAIILAGKAQDMFYAYDNEPIIVIDIPRADTLEYINYGAIEKLKDGVFFSGKYNSCLKLREHQAHVLVFSNEEPQRNKWTADRLRLIYVTSEMFK